jgi:EAL domain-containing protein (putative c-di-GMP-specific phosphodiesterase class I)
MSIASTCLSVQTSLLVVEDDPLVRKMLVRAFSLPGYAVDAAENVSAGEALLSTREYDVVLSDLAMPERDGIELLRLIRRRDPDLPVIIMTGRPDIESASAAVELHALRYLTKPVDVQELRGVVADAAELGREARVRRASARASAAATAALGATFDRALASVTMAFQPIVAWSRRAVLAREALVRPTEPAMNNPGKLFVAAEQLGRVVDLGRTIRQRVAETLATADFDAFVNVHPLELGDEDLYSPAAPLTAYARRVVLEITERAALGEVADLEGRIARLRALGFRIALDDLGAGYAGLTSVAQLEPEVVKLDMSLVRDIHHRPTQQRLVKSMVDLFRDMGRLVVVEGVETIDEAQCLAGLGCDLFQGYLFARPSREILEPTWPVVAPR